jgi:hypothetical protein
MIKKIFFGHYPQTMVTDETLIRKLDEYSEFEISFNGRKYVKILRTSDNTSYHYFKKTSYVKNRFYYFLVEEVEWDLIAETDSHYLYLSSKVLDCARFGSTEYETSKIRNFLSILLEKLFNQDEILQLKEYNNFFANSNIQDKLFLLKADDIIKYSDISGNTIIKGIPTDFSTFKGVQTGDLGSYGDGTEYWTSQVYQDDSFYTDSNICYIDKSCHISGPNFPYRAKWSGNFDQEKGVRPALIIKKNSLPNLNTDDMDKRLIEFVTTIKETIKTIAIYKGMINMWQYHKGNDIYENLVNYSVQIATIKLSNIIGTNKENSHWKNMITSTNREQLMTKIHSIFKDSWIYNDKQSNWYKYWSNLIEFRNRFVTHFSLNNESYVPDFSNSLEVLYNIIDTLSLEHNIIDHNYEYAKSFYEECYRMTIDYWTV